MRTCIAYVFAEVLCVSVWIHVYVCEVEGVGSFFSRATSGGVLHACTCPGCMVVFIHAVSWFYTYVHVNLCFHVCVHTCLCMCGICAFGAMSHSRTNSDGYSQDAFVCPPTSRRCLCVCVCVCVCVYVNVHGHVHTFDDCMTAIKCDRCG